MIKFTKIFFLFFYLPLSVCAFSKSSGKTKLIHNFSQLQQFVHDWKPLDLTNYNPMYRFAQVEKLFCPMSERYLSKGYFEKLELETKLLAAIPSKLHTSAKIVLPLVLKVSEKYKIDPLWMISIIWAESHFSYKAKSYLGASGLMQLMPITQTYLEGQMRKKQISLYAELSSDELVQEFSQITLAEQKLRLLLRNLEIGAYYLSYLYEKFNNPHYATVAYNMGPGWVKRNLASNKEVAGPNNQYLNKVKSNYLVLTLPVSAEGYRLAML